MLQPNRECRLKISTGKKAQWKGLLQNTVCKKNEGKTPAVVMSEEAGQTPSQDSGQTLISILKFDFSKAKLTNPVYWIEE